MHFCVVHVKSYQRYHSITQIARKIMLAAIACFFNDVRETNATALRYFLGSMPVFDPIFLTLIAVCLRNRSFSILKVTH